MLAAATARGYRVVPRLAGRVHASTFVDTRGLGRAPSDMCPLGARPIEMTGVYRVATAYQWGDREPGVLATHGWGADSTTMSAVVDVAVAQGKSAICFDAPGHGVSPGWQSTIGEYADAIAAVLQRFPSIHTVVAHSLSAIAAVDAVAKTGPAVRGLLLLAPVCSLRGILESWVAQQRLPSGVTELIANELNRRDGIPVPDWDIRAMELAPTVQVCILHDPQDNSVPVSHAHQIVAAVGAELIETPGLGHQGILGSAQMRTALTSLLARQDLCQSPPRKAAR